jgi:polyhydroxyalkanoate synthesis regulator phasin
LAEPSSSSRRPSVPDALRRYVDALVGLTETSRERAEKIVSDLADRGQTRARDIERGARELADRSARNRRELVRLVQKEIRHQISSLGLASRADVERLQKRIRDLEKKATTRKPAAARKPTPKKKSQGSGKR